MSVQGALRFGILLFCGLWAVTPAQMHATTITSTSFNSWKSSLSGAPTEADFTAVRFTDYSTPSGISLNATDNSGLAFTFTGPDNGGYSLMGAVFNNFTSLEGGSDAGASVNIALPGAGENAVLISGGSTGATPLTLTLSDGESFSVNSAVFGLALSHPVTSLVVTTAAGSRVALDDFWFGSSSLAQDPPADPTSEGATLLLVSGGLLTIFGKCKKTPGTPAP